MEDSINRRVEGLVSAATASNASQQIGSTAAPTVAPTNHHHLGQQAQARDDNDEGRHMDAEELADAKDEGNLDEGKVLDDSTLL